MQKYDVTIYILMYIELYVSSMQMYFILNSITLNMCTVTFYFTFFLFFVFSVQGYFTFWRVNIIPNSHLRLTDNWGPPFSGHSTALKVNERL